MLSGTILTSKVRPVYSCIARLCAATIIATLLFYSKDPTMLGVSCAMNITKTDNPSASLAAGCCCCLAICQDA